MTLHANLSMADMLAVLPTMVPSFNEFVDYRMMWHLKSSTNIEDLNPQVSPSTRHKDEQTWRIDVPSAVVGIMLMMAQERVKIEANKLN